MNDYVNYYDLLEIKKDATKEEIKKAYRNQAKKWHPDLNKDPKSGEMTRKINEAKEILLDDQKRKDYDYYLDNYKNDIYDKVDKDYSDNSKNEEYYEKNTYTKWEYFDIYLKYYKVSIFRKIIATILVIIESLLCSIIELLNYLFALIINYFSYYLSIIFFVLAIIGFVFVGFDLISSIDILKNVSDYLLLFLGSVYSFFISVYITELPFVMINKVPVMISKLNMFLFKKIIGYKTI